MTERLLTALAFLTRIPVGNPTDTPEAIGRSASVFPVIGALVGDAEILVLWTFRDHDRTHGIVLTGATAPGWTRRHG
jgi:cobalamin synthase